MMGDPIRDVLETQLQSSTDHTTEGTSSSKYLNVIILLLAPFVPIQVDLQMFQILAVCLYVYMDIAKAGDGCVYLSYYHIYPNETCLGI